MNRRKFLERATAVGIAGVTGCLEGGSSDSNSDKSPTAEAPSTPGETPTQTPQSDQQKPTPQSRLAVDTSNMTEIAVDLAEGEEVTDVINDITDGQILVFPSSRFKWSDSAVITTDNWGIRCQKQTVFEVPSGIGDGAPAELLKTHDGSKTADNFILENLTFDSPDRAAPALYLGVRHNAHLAGLHYKMNGPQSNRWQENGLRVFVKDPDGRMLIDDYTQFNNGDLGAYGNGKSRIGLWVGRRNAGTVHVRNPVLQGFPNNACYVSRQPGKVIIEGGQLMDNNVSAIRVSGGVEVHGTTISIDIDRYLEGPGVVEGSTHNTRGVWGDNRESGTDGGLVTDSVFILKSYRSSSGLATVLENPRFTVRNCTFVLDANIDSIVADVGEIVVENCDFGGMSFGSTAGVGNITGFGNRISMNIDPGDVPYDELCSIGYTDNPDSGYGPIQRCYTRNMFESGY